MKTKYEVVLSGRFKKSFKRCARRGLDTRILDEVIRILAMGELLPPKYRAHMLCGQYSGYMECHIQPDWLLVWRVDGDRLLLVLVDTGTHADLFG